MKLFKWDTNFKPKFPNIIEKFRGKKITDEAAKGQEVATIPSVNIADSEKLYEITLALPGYDKKEIKVEIQDRCLIVSSEKQYEQEEKSKNWIRKEYGYASFQRMFELPENADENKVQAQMRNGILTIKVEKIPGFKSGKKEIPVLMG